MTEIKRRPDLPETAEFSVTLERTNFDVELPQDISVEIQELKYLSEENFVDTIRPILRACMTRIRHIEGEKIRGDKWIYHMLPDPNDSGRKNPLVVLPGRGCGYEKATGGCSMCNFAGDGRDITTRDVDEAMEFLIENQKDKKVSKININALGSFFSDREISPDIRAYIYSKIKEHADKMGEDGLVVFITEARIDHITEERVKEMREAVGRDVIIDIGVGVESTDYLLREAVINKGLPVDWEDKLRMIRGYQPMDVTVHTMFGTPFLDEGQSVRETVKSIRDCIRMENQDGEHVIDSVLLMVMNRKPGTLTDYLSRSGQYRMPNLMAVAESLLTIGESVSTEELKRVRILGLVGPDVHVKAGTEYVSRDPDHPELDDIYDILLEWRGTPEELDKLRIAYQAVSQDVRDQIGYGGPYEGEGLSEEEKTRLRTSICEAYYRIATTLFPELQGSSFAEISDHFKQN
ncbi:MAG: hypothetical protein ABII18_06670 [bacterium]